MNNSQDIPPVLLIHGLNDTIKIFRKMSAYLKSLGWSVYSLNLIPSNGDKCLEELALQVLDYINKTFPPEQPINLLGFSMGGIISRYYIQRLGGINRVQNFITISSPHYGTKIAYLSQRPGCVQMRPNHKFLQDLNADVTMLEKLNFTSIWTPFDLMIVPANSSEMPIGKNITIPVILHPWMVSNSQCLKIVADALSHSYKN